MSLRGTKIFPCERCGKCCRRVGEVFFALHLARPDNVCKFLDEETNLCTIYETRPIFCRVDEFYEKNLSHEMSREEFYRINKELCKKFRAESPR